MRPKEVRTAAKRRRKAVKHNIPKSKSAATRRRNARKAKV